MVVTYEHRRETCKYMHVHVHIHLNNFHCYFNILCYCASPNSVLNYLHLSLSFYFAGNPLETISSM